jgi:acetyl esterase/lipase
MYTANIFSERDFYACDLLLSSEFIHYSEAIDGASFPSSTYMEEENKSACNMNAVNASPAGAEEYSIEIETGTHSLQLVVVRPEHEWRITPVFLFVSGGNATEDDYAIYRKQVGDLVTVTGFTAVFVKQNSTRVSSHAYRIGEVYAAAEWVARYGDQIRVDGTKPGIVGADAGAGIAVCITVMAKEKSYPAFCSPVLMIRSTEGSYDTFLENAATMLMHQFT